MPATLRMIRPQTDEWALRMKTKLPIAVGSAILGSSLLAACDWINPFASGCSTSPVLVRARIGDTSFEFPSKLALSVQRIGKPVRRTLDTSRKEHEMRQPLCQPSSAAPFVADSIRIRFEFGPEFLPKSLDRLPFSNREARLHVSLRRRDRVVAKYLVPIDAPYFDINRRLTVEPVINDLIWSDEVALGLSFRLDQDPDLIRRQVVKMLCAYQVSGTSPCARADKLP